MCIKLYFSCLLPLWFLPFCDSKAGKKESFLRSADHTVCK
jgi:hypothetical protein